MPAFVERRILREEWEVESRLAELQLEKPKLLIVRSTAISAAADATQFHPANAAGTFSYHHGTFSLRNEHVGKIWSLARPNGVEAILNNSIRVQIVFANVDIACDDEHEPRPRSNKGAGNELICAGNDLFGGLPRFARTPEVTDEGWITYYLMVAPDGAVELTCCSVKGGKFTNFIERIYLSDGSDLDGDLKLLLDDRDVTDDFDPKVVRK